MSVPAWAFFGFTLLLGIGGWVSGMTGQPDVAVACMLSGLLSGVVAALFAADS